MKAFLVVVALGVTISILQTASAKSLVYNDRGDTEIFQHEVLAKDGKPSSQEPGQNLDNLRQFPIESRNNEERREAISRPPCGMKGRCYGDATLENERSNNFENLQQQQVEYRKLAEGWKNEETRESKRQRPPCAKGYCPEGDTSSLIEDNLF